MSHLTFAELFHKFSEKKIVSSEKKDYFCIRIKEKDTQS